MLAELRADFRWLAAGFLLTFCSGFGQTYFIALFAGHLKADLGLSEGGFGGLYTAGTLASAALLMWAGRLADDLPIRRLGVGVMAGLALVSLGMASVSSPFMLALVFFGLRFFGQGMLTHIAMTAMGRWFNARRGRAVSIAVLGLSSAEAAFPIAAVALVAALGWRMTWVAIAAALFVLPTLALIALVRRDRVPETAEAAPGSAAPAPERHHWTRGEVIRSPLFYALMPVLLAPPFILTGIFINQVTVVETKGWDLAWFAASFPVLAGVNMISGLGTGWLVDRFGARHVLPFFLLPLAAAIAALAFIGEPWVLPVFMALAGITMGSAGTLGGALWAELYGTLHLGAIRGVATSAMVFSTALSPGLIGVLLDAGVPFLWQLLAMGAYCLAAAAWSLLLIPGLDRTARGERPIRSPAT
ncbi:MFS family permease [Parvibaculum indicum]|uniref:MFS transporter n=1 Tax=Parvibaculum indicum TaxID=562969 RepID=UPI00141EF6C8|nr:MFS transporter [Parvibaculum indicum]NIJ42362.1 MFS family permease [Parvibaculum indicum]